jgi:sugar/nucleoside kinase (ribokinase family)
VFPDYLLVGHIAHDETPDGPKLGGTVSYAGSTADALGMKVAMVTSAQHNEVVMTALPIGAKVHLVESPHSTIFVNNYVGDVRRQVLRSRAATLSLSDIPMAWRNAPIVHLAPLDDEIDPQLALAFPDSFCAATPQGWMRAWNDEGLVRPKPWADADALLPLLNATILSEEDIQQDRELEAHYASCASLLVVTRAAKGCTVYQKGEEPINIPAPVVQVVDATGAGDVFASVFLIMMQRTGYVRRAAEIAVHLASYSVTRVGMEGVPTHEYLKELVGN